jgi:hypothetical protein
VFQADRHSADRRRHARPKVGWKHAKAEHWPWSGVHSKRFPFETNPTSRLTARTSRSLGRICSANSAVAVARFFTAVCFDFFGQQETRE